MEALFFVNEEVKKKPVIIYGTEEMGKACLNELVNSGVNVEFFCSTNAKEFGTTIRGRRVISLDELLSLEDFNIVITVEKYQDILSKLNGKTEHNMFIYRNIYNISLL